MSLSALAVRRPVTTGVFFLIVVLFGGVSFSRLPIDLLPDLTFPTVSVSVQYPGVGPEEIERLISIPIEEAASTVPGIEEISATSQEGQSQVSVQFEWGVNLDAAMNDIRANLDRIRDRFPEDATQPVVRRFDPSQLPIVFFGLEGSLNPRELRRLAENEIKGRIERVAGVGQINVMGGAKREIQVYLRKEHAEALGISLSRIAQVLAADNQNVPAGTIEQGNDDVLIRTYGELQTAEDVGRVVVENRDGQPITVSDVARVVDGVADEKRLVRVNGRPAVMLAVSRQSGANTVEVAQALKAEAVRINRDFSTVQLVPIFDQSKYIQQAIDNVKMSALIGSLLAVIVLFFFLGSVSATLIVALSIPISVIATFWLMFQYKISLNLMSFGGLALGVGMLVDNAVVILENIYRHRELGTGPEEAAIRGAQEVSSAVIASSLTTAVVFLPIVFVEGTAGELFQQLAIVVVFSLMCSLFGSLTLVPVMSRFGLAPGSRKSMFERFSAGFQRLLDSLYVRVLDKVLRYRGLVFAGSAALLGATLPLVGFIGREYLPTVDEGQIRIELKGAVGGRLDSSLSAALAVEKALAAQVPELESNFSTIGGSLWRGGGTHEAGFRIQLVPRDMRKRSDQDIASLLRKSVAEIPGFGGFVRTQSGLFVFRRIAGGDDGFVIEVRGQDQVAGAAVAERIREMLEKTPGLTRPEIKPTGGRPEMVVTPDRERASLYGISVEDAAKALEDHLRGRVPTFLRTGVDETDVRVWLDPEDRASIDMIQKVPVFSSTGQAIPLGAISNLERRIGPEQILRLEKQRMITVSASIVGRSSSDIVADLRPQLRELPLPAGITIRIAGDWEQQQKSFSDLTMGLAFAILLVYLVMAAQFEDFKWPLIVMFSIPFGLVGVILTLLATETTLNVQSFIGLIMLAGVVVNNAIVLIDYIRFLRQEEGKELLEAIREGGRTRLRPVLITTTTTVLAMVPLAIGIGQGGEMQAPMARVVIGGLLVSSMVTLVLIPAIYASVEESFGSGE